MNRGERISEIIRYKNISLTELGNILGVKKQSVSNWKNLQQEIPDKYLIKLVEVFPDINARWIITGEGTLDGEIKIQHEKEEKLEKNFNEIIELKDKQLEDKERIIEMKDEIIRLMQKK